MAAYRRVYDHVTFRLTVRNGDQLWNPMLGNEVWATFTFFYTQPSYGHTTVKFLLQGGHLFGKPGNVRQFFSSHGNVGGKKILSAQSLHWVTQHE